MFPFELQVWEKGLPSQVYVWAPGNFAPVSVEEDAHLPAETAGWADMHIPVALGAAVYRLRQDFPGTFSQVRM